MRRFLSLNDLHLDINIPRRSADAQIPRDGVISVDTALIGLDVGVTDRESVVFVGGKLGDVEGEEIDLDGSGGDDARLACGLDLQAPKGLCTSGKVDLGDVDSRFIRPASRDRGSLVEEERVTVPSREDLHTRLDALDRDIPVVERLLHLRGDGVGGDLGSKGNIPVNGVTGFINDHDRLILLPFRSVKIDHPLSFGDVDDLDLERAFQGVGDFEGEKLVGDGDDVDLIGCEG